MVNVLIIDDKELGLKASYKELFEKSLKDCLGDLYESLRIRSITIDFNRLPYFGEHEGIRGAVGYPEDIIKVIGDVEVLLLRSHAITAKVIKAGKNLRFIGVLRGNCCNVDGKAAHERGIPCVHTRGRNADTIADFTLGLLIAQNRYIVRACNALKRGTVYEEWESWPRPIFALSGKTLGIIGLGYVGREVAKRAKGFDMKIIIYDPYVPKNVVKEFGEKVDLETLLKESDFISICASLTPETKHMIGEKEISLMKRTLIIVNTARGAIIDERALYEALKNKKIRGAALDVFEQDRPIDLDNPLLRPENITVTPHISGWPSERSHEVGAFQIAESLKRFLEGKRLSREELCDPITGY